MGDENERLGKRREGGLKDVQSGEAEKREKRRSAEDPAQEFCRR
jgi:hypothetical protein